jgi:ferredoxin
VKQANMAISRRDLLRGRFKAAGQAREVLPPGVDILLDRDRCTAWGKGICTACEPVCPERAVFFVGMMNPRILADRCTLCGDCVIVCPTAAIVIRPDSTDNTDVVSATLADTYANNEKD